MESEELKKGNVAVNMYLSVDKQKTAKMIYDKSDELNIKAVDNSLQRNGDSSILFRDRKAKRSMW